MEDNMIRTCVLFGPKEIQFLRNKLPVQNQSSSKFELIVACLWKCRTIALEIDCNDNVRLSFVVNVHDMKGIDLPIGYYGNAFVYPAAMSKAGTLVENSLAYALDLVQQAKNRVNEEYVRSTTDLMVIKGRPLYGTPLNYLVSDTRSLGLEKIDLGWRKAIFGGVHWANSDFSFFSNMNHNVEGDDGVVISICLPSLALEKMKYELRKMTCIEPINKL